MGRRNFSEEFCNALEEEIRACGLPTIKEMQEWLRALTSGRALKSKYRSFEMGLLGGAAKDLRLAAKKKRIKSEEDLNRALKQIRGLRYQVRPALAEAVAKLRDKIPGKKRGPRPRLNETERRSVCSTVETFKMSGMTTKFAIEQTAKRYKVSPRLIRKIWENKGR